MAHHRLSSLLLTLPFLLLLRLPGGLQTPALLGEWCPWRPFDCRLVPGPHNASLCKAVLIRGCCLDASQSCPFSPKLRLAPARNDCLTAACAVRAHWCAWSPWQQRDNASCGEIVRRRRRERCCHPGTRRRLGEDGFSRGPGDDVEVDSVLEAVPCEGEEAEVEEVGGVGGPAVVLVPGPTPGPLLVAAAAAIPVAFVLAFGAAVGAVVCCRRERQRRYECEARAFWRRYAYTSATVSNDRTPLCSHEPREPPPSYEESVHISLGPRD